MYTHIVHESQYYTSSSSIAVNATGIIFAAVVINPPNNQYIAIHRIDPSSGENREILRLTAKDQRDFNISEGADPSLLNGKYGNVDIDIHGADIYLIAEIRYDNINKQRWAILKGRAI